MCVLPRHRRSAGLLTPPTCVMQIRDLNSGTFGFVQLAKDKQTGELVACKFIERGDKVWFSFCLQHGGCWGPTRGLGGLDTPGSRRSRCCTAAEWGVPVPLQVTKYVEREILNHRCLVHPHIVQFKEVKPCLHPLLSLPAQNARLADSPCVPAQCACVILFVPAQQHTAQHQPNACMHAAVRAQRRATQVFLTSQHLGISMEFASGGDMFEYVVKKNGLREEEARWFFQQLIVGLDYCHRMVRARAAGAEPAGQHAAASSGPRQAGGQRAAAHSTAQHSTPGRAWPMGDSRVLVSARAVGARRCS